MSAVLSEDELRKHARMAAQRERFESTVSAFERELRPFVGRLDQMHRMVPAALLEVIRDTAAGFAEVHATITGHGYARPLSSWPTVHALAIRAANGQKPFHLLVKP